MFYIRILIISILEMLVLSNSIYDFGQLQWKIVNSNQSILLDGNVPGGIYSEMAHKLREYMFYEYNDMKFRWIAHDNWTYFTHFEITPSDVTYKRVHLVLHGADTMSEIYINDKFVGTTTNMFVRYRYDVKNVVKVGLNSLYVNFTSPIAASSRIASMLPYKIPSECWPNVYHGECHINKLRKMQASFAWDWGPAFPSVGLWKSVELEISQGIQLRSAGIFLTLEEDYWRLTVRAWFDTDNDVRGILAGQLSIPGQGNIRSETLATIKALTCEGRVVLLVPKTKVHLWWPNGYGDQNLYELTVSFKTGHETLSKTIQIGFRTVKVIEQPVDEDLSKGRTFYFSVNDVPIFAKGSNWIPSDIFPENHANEERVTRLLNDAKESNFNMIRVWGGGVYESDLFYNLCDKLGILIWQDLMFACNMYPAVEGFLQIVKTEVVQQVQRLQHHPSIAVWAGNNENEVALIQNWYGTNRNFALYKSDYIKLYVETIQPIIESLDPQRSYFPSSPSNGVETVAEGYIATYPQSNLYGDVHYYNYLGNLWDWRVFPKPRFASEYGVQSLPAYSTLLNAMNISEAVWISQVMQWKQHFSLGYIPVLVQIQMNLPPARELKDIIYLSQINQAMSIKTETEHYRRLKSTLLPTAEGLTMGALYWQLNDVWEAPSWSSIDYLGNWKMLHYFARDFFASLIVSPILESDDQMSIVIISDLLMAVSEAQLFIDIYDWSSFIPISSHKVVFSIGPNQSKKVLQGNLTYFLGTCPNKMQCFLKFALSLPSHLATIIVPQNYLFPLSLKHANFSWANIKIEKFTLQNKNEGYILLSTDKIALFVWIERLGARGEDGIKFSDNGFHMVETYKEIKVISRFPMETSFVSSLRVTNLKPKYM
uniref:Beta-mannosidase B n=1 Tax=Panstrongylus lignarius TaxID=156445 RepID=A0A224XIF3_9HEMI